MTTIHGPTDAGWATPARGGRARWRDVRRHSRRVRMLRIALPAIAALVFVAMFISFRSISLGIGELSLGQVGVEGTTLTMANPSLSGFGDGGLSYEVNAERALQDITRPDLVRMEGISGRMERPDGSWTTLEARYGEYDSSAETLRLEDDIVIVTHDERRVYLENADVELRTQDVVTDRPVLVVTPDARVRGDSMEIAGGGQTIVLRNRVRVDLDRRALMQGAEDGQSR